MLSCKVQIFNQSRFELPRAMSEGASGLDLRADIEKPMILWPGVVTIIPTGIYLSIEEGYEGQVRARSGLAAKHGITLVNGIGTIDADYRGEIKVILMNLKKTNYTVKPGERIAQLVFCPVARPQIFEVEDRAQLGKTARADGGFGHSGKN